jgi:peptide/nickel transport system permease protein
MNRFKQIVNSWNRFLDSDLFFSFQRSRITIVATLIMVVIPVSGFLAPWIAPHNPFDLASLNLMDSEIPPAWMEGGDPRFFLGTDNQGRDILSAILYGSRVSLAVGAASVAFALVLGLGLGLISGYFGGVLDTIIMRVADVMLSFPTILIALLINGVARGLLPRELHEESAILVLILSIGLSSWVQYARTVRGSTMVERDKEYTQAAQVIGLHPLKILVSHVLPNIMGPVLVIATISFGLAILMEATLSFLGVGMPPTQPSLGTLIRMGNEYLYSGIWWVVIFPSTVLVILVLAINLLGDWLRDALNPKLR